MFLHSYLSVPLSAEAKTNPAYGGVSYSAPGRAGESPLHARQGEVLAERQGCRGRLRIWRKPKAKRWPDEQEADRRRRAWVRRPLSSKPDACTERHGADPTGISVKVGASNPGRFIEICKGALCY